MTDMTVAKTILAQLGGNKFIAMTGAKDFVGGANSLQFSISSRLTKNKSNKVRIVLDPSDTYTMTFYKIRGIDFKEVDSVSDVYAEDLQRIFTAKTGLDTHL